jgi:hypothetical protein
LRRGRIGKKSGEKGKTSIKSHVHIHAVIVRYDASYFQPHQSGTHRSLQENHIILTTEEALREGCLELDMDGVLIKDTDGR